MAVFYKYEYMEITKNIHPWTDMVGARIKINSIPMGDRVVLKGTLIW